jgi:hypothetical protein
MEIQEFVHLDQGLQGNAKLSWNGHSQFAHARHVFVDQSLRDVLLLHCGQALVFEQGR